MVDPQFLKFQAVALAIAAIPFFIGLWYYRRDRRIDKTGARAEGYVIDTPLQKVLPDVDLGPITQKGREAQYHYIVKYVCRHGYTRTLDVYDSGIQAYTKGETVEVAYLLENAAIARLTSDLYLASVIPFVIAGVIIAIPGLVKLIF